MEAEVVIVGGGLTGLSLAQKLAGEGMDYLLLEARDRFGGRILSASMDHSDDRHDLGPSWIWPGQPRIAQLISELGLRTFQQHSAGTLVFEEASGNVARDFDFATMGGALRIERGVASIIDAIVEVLDREKLRVSHTVTRVAKRNDRFRIGVTTPDGMKDIYARSVVLAAPPRVAEKTIVFDPPLSRGISDALRGVPTWMAGQAKLVAVYDQPFWREMGLNGDGVSRRGPLTEVHDATPASSETGALFGFVGVPVGSQQRDRPTLIDSAVLQLEAMFGARAASPIDVLVKDWASDSRTATQDDASLSQHPAYGLPTAIADAMNEGMMFVSSEMASQFGGLLEGALEAAEVVAKKLIGERAS